MPRLKVSYGHNEYWCLVAREPSPAERGALADEVARRLVEAAPLAPGQHVTIILDALTEAQRRLEGAHRGLA